DSRAALLPAGSGVPVYTGASIYFSSTSTGRKLRWAQPPGWPDPLQRRIPSLEFRTRACQGASDEVQPRHERATLPPPHRCVIARLHWSASGGADDEGHHVGQRDMLGRDAARWTTARLRILA